MRYFLSLLILFCGFGCNVGNYVTRTEFGERLMSVDEEIENLRLCDQRRTWYELTVESCYSRLPLREDLLEIAEAMQRESAPPAGTAEYEREILHRMNRAVAKSCDFACVFETHCYEPSTESCDLLQQELERIRANP